VQRSNSFKRTDTLPASSAEFSPFQIDPTARRRL